jgi:DNA-binding LytR/AlgR family response regulator
MINAIIVEDEVHLLRYLQRKLAQLWPELCIVATCQNGRVALEAIKTYQPQLVFLDIQLGDIDGLRLAETLPANCALVFVTAFADFALPAFEQGAVDYLLKPYSAARLGQCLQKVQCFLAGLQYQSSLHHVPQNSAAALEITSSAEADVVTSDMVYPHVVSPNLAKACPLPSATEQSSIIPSATTLLDTETSVFAQAVTASEAMGQPAMLALNIGQIHWLQPIREVRAIQAQGRYVAVVCLTKTALLRQSFQQLLQQCAAFQFVQIHRSIAINLRYLEHIKVTPNKQMLLYINGLTEPIQVSRRFQAVLRRQWLPPQTPSMLAFGDTGPDQAMRDKLRL